MVPALRQHEEGCLKGVFGVLDSTEDVPADPEHHRSVPLDQRLEGGLRVFFLPGQEPRQEEVASHPSEGRRSVLDLLPTIISREMKWVPTWL